MRVLVASREGERIASAGRTAGFDVRVENNDAVAAKAAADHAADVVIVDATLPSAPAIVRMVRDLAQRPFVFVSHAATNDEILAALFDAGADGDLRANASSAYVCARLKAVQRRVAAGAVARGATLSPPKLPGPIPLAELASLAPNGRTVAPVAITKIAKAMRSTGWTTSVEKLAGAAGKFLTLEVATSELRGAMPPMALGATILLLDAVNELEIRIAIASDVPSTKALAIHLFGEEGADLATDVMTELANILMGTLKTSFAPEGMTFTGGLPEIVPVETVFQPPVAYKAQEAVLLQIADARLVLHLGLRSRANVTLTAGGLREGMVVVKDVFNPRGMLLIRAQSRLSENMIQRLRGGIPPQQAIEVIAP